MALPFLPHEHIPQMFIELKDVATSQALRSLVEYVWLPGWNQQSGLRTDGAFSIKVYAQTMMLKDGIIA